MTDGTKRCHYLIFIISSELKSSMFISKEQSLLNTSNVPSNIPENFTIIIFVYN